MATIIIELYESGKVKSILLSGMFLKYKGNINKTLNDSDLDVST